MSQYIVVQTARHTKFGGSAITFRVKSDTEGFIDKRMLRKCSQRDFELYNIGDHPIQHELFSRSFRRVISSETFNRVNGHVLKVKSKADAAWWRLSGDLVVRNGAKLVGYFEDFDPTELYEAAANHQAALNLNLFHRSVFHSLESRNSSTVNFSSILSEDSPEDIEVAKIIKERNRCDDEIAKYCKYRIEKDEELIDHYRLEVENLFKSHFLAL